MQSEVCVSTLGSEPSARGHTPYGAYGVLQAKMQAKMQARTTGVASVK